MVSLTGAKYTTTGYFSNKITVEILAGTYSTGDAFGLRVFAETLMSKTIN